MWTLVQVSQSRSWYVWVKCSYLLAMSAWYLSYLMYLICWIEAMINVWFWDLCFCLYFLLNLFSNLYTCINIQPKDSTFFHLSKTYSFIILMLNILVQPLSSEKSIKNFLYFVLVTCDGDCTYNPLLQMFSNHTSTCQNNMKITLTSVYFIYITWFCICVYFW